MYEANYIMPTNFWSFSPSLEVHSMFWQFEERGNFHEGPRERDHNVIYAVGRQTTNQAYFLRFLKLFEGILSFERKKKRLLNWKLSSVGRER